MMIPHWVVNICQVFANNGYEAYLVGGCVRDYFLGIEPKDFDIATNATPEQVQGIFNRVLPTGIQYGTVTVTDGEEPVEVTTYRSDSITSDGRRPDSVTYATTITEDLSRRDFTVNAIAYDVLTGVVEDPFGGCGDIQEKVLRAVGNPKQRFLEDGLRILRAIRFASQKGFVLEVGLREAILESLDYLDNVSKERTRDELMKTLGGEYVGDGLTLLQELGVFGKICPELAKQPGLSQNRYHSWDIWEHTRQCVISEKSRKPILRLAILLHDIAKPVTRAEHPKNPGEYQFLEHEDVGARMAEEWMQEYRFSGDEVRYVSHLIKHHLIYYTSDWNDRQIRRWLRRVGDEFLDDLLALRRADISGKAPDVTDLLRDHDEMVGRLSVLKAHVPHKTSNLAINGHDVMTILGIKGGREVGEVLKALMGMVTDDPEINNRESLEQIVKEGKYNEWSSEGSC